MFLRVGDFFGSCWGYDAAFALAVRCCWWGVVLVVLLFDQLTKLAVRAVGDALHVTVIPGVIDFLFVRNIGAAFSMGEGHGVAFA